jgi:hypothetical protein
MGYIAGQHRLDIAEYFELPSEVRTRSPLRSHDVGKRIIDCAKQRFLDRRRSNSHLGSFCKLWRSGQNLKHQPAQHTLRCLAGFENLEIETRPGPATVLYPRSKDDRGVLPRGSLNRAIGGAAVSNHDGRPVAFDAVETDRNAIIDRKSDSAPYRCFR